LSRAGELTQLLSRDGWERVGEPQSFGVGWGSQTCDAAEWQKKQPAAAAGASAAGGAGGGGGAGVGGLVGGAETLLVMRSPHWSQFKLFNRAKNSPECAAAVARMVGMIASRLH
jgi:hypothetical protein